MPVPTEFNGKPVSDEDKAKFEEMLQAMKDAGNIDNPHAVAMAKWQEWMMGKKHSQEAEEFSIENVPVFASGKWNGDEYSESDLDNMVTNFNHFKNSWKVPLKLGHDPKQKLAQQDGWPSVGWLTELKKDGNKLFATFKGIPRKIKELIDRKAYGRFSSEILWNLQKAGNVYKRVLSGVALLGADMPAVNSIDDILGLYSLNGADITAGELHAYHITKKEKGEISMTEQELQDKLAAKDAELKTFKAQNEATEAKNKELESQLNAQKLEVARVACYALIDGGITVGKIPPALRERFASLILAQADDKGKMVHTYADKNETKSLQYTSTLEALKGIIDELPVYLKKGEHSQDDDSQDRISDSKKDKVTDPTTGQTFHTDQSLHEMAMKIVAEKKIEYKQALIEASIEASKKGE